jgi:hypothetical protein
MLCMVEGGLVDTKRELLWLRMLAAAGFSADVHLKVKFSGAYAASLEDVEEVQPAILEEGPARSDVTRFRSRSHTQATRSGVGMSLVVRRSRRHLLGLRQQLRVWLPTPADTAFLACRKPLEAPARRLVSFAGAADQVSGRTSRTHREGLPADGGFFWWSSISRGNFFTKASTSSFSMPWWRFRSRNVEL